MVEGPDDRAVVERALMDRFRAQANREPEPAPPRLLQHVVALALALALVFLVMFGFDRFLTSVQKFMEIEVVEPAPTTGAPAATEPMPAFVVPSDVSPPPPADPDPRPSQAPAPDSAPATPR